MGMSRLISQLFFGFFFSWKYHTQASTMSSFSGCAKSTQTSQPTHTSCHSYTASHRAHNILTGLSQFCVGHFPSSCPCYKLSITPSLSHRTAFAYYCLLLIVIYISAETELHHFLFFKRILCTCKFWMLACVIWLWLLFKMFPKWGTCDP